MSFWEFLAGLAESSVVFGGAVILLTAFVMAGLISGSVVFGIYVADEFGWGWNLLIVPVVIALELFLLALGVWLTVTIVGRY